jgi:hypothetical protein
MGMGSHGTRFLQTALWFYQRKGICVEVHVFDNGAGGEKRKQLGQKCPELVEINPSTAEGDACYRIEFYNTDCFSSAMLSRRS